MVQESGQTHGSPLAPLLKVIAELEQLSQKILQAGAQGDEITTRSLVDQTRQKRAELYSIDISIKNQLDQQELEIRQTVQQQLNNIAKSEAFTQTWCSRYRNIASQEKLLLDDFGCNNILDDLIPQVWDWNLDIFIFPGNIDDKIIRALLNRGQKKICIFSFGRDMNFVGHENIAYLHKKEDAYIYFQSTQIFSGARVKYITISADPAAEAIDPKYDQKEYLEEFHMAFIHHIAGINTIKLQGARLMAQGLKNLSNVAASAPFSALEKQFEGVPMVIVSPGPSLDKNIEGLRSLKGQALIVAPAQSALALTRAGVVPDLIVIADCNEMQYLLDGVPMDQVEALILGVACFPDLYTKYHGKIITFNANQGVDAWISDIFKETIKLPAGGSVSTDALCMGVYLRCDPIILVGQDFAFSDSQQYSKNSADGQVEIVKNKDDNTISYKNLTAGLEHINVAGGFNTKTLKEPLLSLPGYYGGTVSTKADYTIFHSEFVKIAESVQREELKIRLLNCTEGGAYIKGFEHITLEQAKKEVYCSYSSNYISEKIREIISGTNIKRRRKSLYTEIVKIQKLLKQSEKIARRCYQVAEKKNHNSATLAQLNKYETELMAAVKKTPFIALASQEKIHKALSLSAEASSIPESLIASKILYRVIIDTVKILSPLIVETINGFDGKKSNDLNYKSHDKSQAL